MLALICDSDPNALDSLSHILYAERRLETKAISDQGEILHYLRFYPVDMIFLSVDSMSIDFSRVLAEAKCRCFDPPICLTSSRERDSILVFRKQCDRFLKKPFDPSEVSRCLEYFDELRGKMSAVNIRTFGRFEVYANGVPVVFRNAKAKELLALCVNNGCEVRCEEAVEKLWPFRPYDVRTKRLYRKAVSSIVSTLEEYGISGIFQKYRGGCAVIRSSFKCDYYSFKDNPEGHLYSLTGEYMRDYFWAETTLANIVRLAEMYSSTDDDLSFLYE